MTSPIRRRTFLGGTVGAVAASAAGLGGGVESVGAVTNGPGRNGVGRGQPRRGGTVVYGVDAEVQGFDPTTAEYDENGYQYARTVFDPLVAVTNTGRTVPYLAESVTSNADASSWTITMRPNVKFHDGTPCDGAAILANLQKQSTSALTGPVFSQFVASVSQTGPLSVQVNMKNPWVTFPFTLSTQVGYVAAPSMLNSPDGTRNPVGTGPFMIDSWVPNDHFTAKRNPNYWRAGLPYLNQITYKPILDATARSQALQSGTIDIMITVTPQTIAQYRGRTQWSYVDNSGELVGEPQVNMIQLNVSKPPFDNANARLALAKAFSQSEFASIITLNVDKPVQSPFAPGGPYYIKTTYPGYDPAGARRLVAAYQKATGSAPSFTLSTIPDAQVQRSATYLQQRWQQAGFQVQLNIVDQNELISQVVAGRYQATTWRQFGTTDPDINYVFWSANTVEKTGLSLNLARNADPRIQSALETGRQSLSASARARAYQSIGEYFAQDLPYIWLGRAVWAVVAKPTVQNFNGPTGPGGQPLIGLDQGVTWPAQFWVG